jgi:hypothetical protein
LKYTRGVSELEIVAANWWPAELTKGEADGSIIPLLLRTQDTFVAAMKVGGKSPTAFIDVAISASLPGNVLLKHLVVLADFGGENLQRVNKQFTALFPEKSAKGKALMRFAWQGNEHAHEFKALPITGLGNKKLGIDGEGLLTEVKISKLHIDVMMILLFGGNLLDAQIAEETFPKCVIGNLLGDAAAIDEFIDQRYIWTSRITGGAEANSLGQKAQTYVVDKLKELVGPTFEIVRNGKILLPNGTPMAFDVVVSKGSFQCGIEVSFQVTTNSTIERKGNEAESRYRLVREAGKHVAYIIDGAGNFQRKSAVGKICANSDCTVAFTDAEIAVLAEFILETSG